MFIELIWTQLNPYNSFMQQLTYIDLLQNYLISTFQQEQIKWLLITIVFIPATQEGGTECAVCQWAHRILKRKKINKQQINK